MTSPVACIGCMIAAPETSALLVPIAQATIIAAPIFMRKQLLNRLRRLRGADPVDPESDDEFDDFPADDAPDD